MPRYVILRHELPSHAIRTTHWDLMLEHEGRLLTWAMPKLPTGNDSLNCTKLPDHRLQYLEYEGEISENRGTVERVEAGELQWLRIDLEAAIEVKLTSCQGTKTVQLTRVANSTQEWLATISGE